MSMLKGMLGSDDLTPKSPTKSQPNYQKPKAPSTPPKSQPEPQTEPQSEGAVTLEDLKRAIAEKQARERIKTPPVAPPPEIPVKKNGNKYEVAIDVGEILAKTSVDLTKALNGMTKEDLMSLLKSTKWAGDIAWTFLEMAVENSPANVIQYYGRDLLAVAVGDDTVCEALVSAILKSPLACKKLLEKLS